MNFRFPVFMDVGGKRCIVTGAGPEVPPKVEALVRAGADVAYIHPEADPAIKACASNGSLRWHQRKFQVSDLDDCFLIIADTEDNAEIFALAEQRNILCNCVDDPSHCRFSFGSLHRQGELTIAISTNGWAPAVAVRIKEWLQQEIGPEYETFLALLKKVRPEISERIQKATQRRELWYDIVDSEILNLLRSGRLEEAEDVLAGMIATAASSTSHSDICGGDVDQ